MKRGINFFSRVTAEIGEKALTSPANQRVL
jgi:hypothetical protein